MKRISNLNTLADLIDRMIVEVNKLSFYENAKREEHAKTSPDTKKIAHFDNLSRDCCEYRSILKNAINETLQQIVRDKEYEYLKEVRTFRAPSKSAGDLIADMCADGRERAREELAEILGNKLNEIKD